MSPQANVIAAHAGGSFSTEAAQEIGWYVFEDNNDRNAAEAEAWQELVDKMKAGEEGSAEVRRRNR